MKRTKARRIRTPQPPQHRSPSQRVMSGPRQFQTFDLAVEPRAPNRWPSLSVCLIVKNEAANLRPCLESLGDLASEIIVVDTGSSDNTVRLARELGVRVHSFPWIDDFAAARNESIRHATQEWIFWLDADDRLSPQAVAQLKRAAASGAADAYMCLVPSTTRDGSQDVTEHVRLFKNGLGIRFHFAIHETVYPDLARLGLRLAYTDIEIEHTGYASPAAKVQKAARNLAIIHHQIDLHPDNVDLVFYRGQARGHANDAHGLAADMREYLARTTAGERFDFKRFWAYTSLISALDAQRDSGGVAQVLVDALAEFPGHPSFLLRAAILHAAEGQVEKALRELHEACRATESPVRGLRPPKAVVEAHLADCYRALDRRQEATHWAEQAWTHDPDSAKAGTILARLYVEEGKTRGAEEILNRLLPSASLPETWLVLAELRHRQGRDNDARDALEEARARGLPSAQASELLASLQAAQLLASTKTQTESSSQQIGVQTRGLAFLTQGRLLEAAQCLAEAIEASPSDPDNYRYLALALRNLGREEEALEAWRLALRWEACASPPRDPLRVASRRP